METNAGQIELAGSGRVTCRNYARLGYARLARGVYGPARDVGDLDEWAVRRERFLALVHAVVAVYGGRPIRLFGPTALQVLGVALPASLEDWDTCHILMPRAGQRPKRDRVVAHCVPPFGPVWRRIGGLPLLHPVDHWLQLRGATDDEMIEVGDGLLRRQAPLLTLGGLTARLGQLTGVAGVKRARRVVRHLAPGTDSIYETRTRLVLVRAGLPRPAVNVPVLCRASGWTDHLDMAYEAERVAVEYDGAVHVGNRHQMEVDAIRRRDLQDEGWLVITVTADQLRAPGRLARSVEMALALRR